MGMLVPARRPERELLDDENLPSEEMARSLDDLELVNRRWGASRTIEDYLVRRLERDANPRPVVLDLGAGSGAGSRRLARALAERGFAATVLGLDLQWRHLAAGRVAADRGAEDPAVAADAFRLPFPARSIDWVVSNLLFHHFSPEQNVLLLREIARVARGGFALLDLRRHLLPLLFVSVFGPLVFQSRVSVADGRASVRQAYTRGEAERIVRDAIPGARVERVFPYRLLIRSSR